MVVCNLWFGFKTVNLNVMILPLSKASVFNDLTNFFVDLLLGFFVFLALSSSLHLAFGLMSLLELCVVCLAFFNHFLINFCVLPLFLISVYFMSLLGFPSLLITCPTFISFTCVCLTLYIKSVFFCSSQFLIGSSSVSQHGPSVYSFPNE